MSSRLEGMHSEGGDVNLYHSLKVDAARQSRKEKVKLPSAILSSKPGGLPNQKVQPSLLRLFIVFFFFFNSAAL